MAKISRKANVIWKGDLKNGNGMISTDSRVLLETPYSFGTRFGEQSGTNPEELIAAAHAACYSMAFAATLRENGYEPEQISTNATCVMESLNKGGYSITGMRLHVRGKVPNIDLETFKNLSKMADEGCPVSNLLREGLDIFLDVELV